MFTTFSLWCVLYFQTYFLLYIQRQDTTFEIIHLSFQSKEATDMSPDERVLQKDILS